METVESLSRRLEALEHIGVGLLVVLLIGALGLAQPLRAAEFTCASGNVACLIDAINQANANGKANRITLRRGTYSMTAANNPGNGLPVITSALTITGQGAETTIIERTATIGESPFRILTVGAAGTLTLQRLTLRGGGSGIGAGINNSGTLTLIDCILTHNFAVFAGGGLFNDGGTVTITHTTFDGNGSTVQTGGLFNSGGTVTIANSTFAHNGTDGTGAIENHGTMTMTNTTVAGNNGGFVGTGGIVNFGFAVLQSTTVADNRGGGFGRTGGISNGGTLILQNTIIANNEGDPTDCRGVITSLGNNLIGDPTGCDITLEPTDLTGDPGLGTFTDNGSPGNGHFPLLSTSQAIDAGNNAVCFRRDQLGKRRVGPCDIGAISFRDKDDRRQEEKDDHRHEEDTAKAYR
jgi:hypothetical protein